MDRNTRHAAVAIAIAAALVSALITSGAVIWSASHDRQPALAVLAAPAVLPTVSAGLAAAPLPDEARAMELSTAQARRDAGSDAARSDPVFDLRQGEAAFADVPGETYRVTALARSFDRLSARAAGGDMIAMRTLVDGLHVCAGAWRVAGRRDDAGDVRQPPEQDVRRADPDAFARRAAPCAGLSMHQLGQRQAWLERLAERGSIEDKLRYVETGAPTLNAADPGFDAAWEAYRATITAYLEEAIAAGHVQALADMARAHREIYPRDDLMVFAYLYAHALVKGDPSARSGAPPPLSIEQARARLTPAQVERAVAIGEDIVRHCCIR